MINRSLKQILSAFIMGSLIAGATVGGVCYLKIKALNTKNTLLQDQIKTQAWREENLTKTQASLQEELTGFKEKKARDYDQTIGALMQAKENANIAALYEIGVKAWQEKDYPRAYFALAQVVKTNPQYKDISKHYPESKKAYDKYQQKIFADKLQQTYLQACDQQANNQFAQAQQNFQQVLEMRPQYKDAQVRLNTVTKYLVVRQRTRDFEQKKQWLESAYKLGLDEQANGRYAQAKEAYKDILEYAPHYKDTARRFKEVSAHLPKTVTTNQAIHTPLSGQQLNCYEKGVAFGKCAALGSESNNCTQADLARLQLECKDNPEFAKGVKSTVSGSGPAGTLLRDLPELLKNL